MPWCQMGDHVQVREGKHTDFVYLINFILQIWLQTLWVEMDGKNIFKFNESHPCFHLMLILYHQILMNVKIIPISVMVANVPTFLESIAVCAMMASWHQWTWKHALVGTIKTAYVHISHTNVCTFMHTHINKRRGFFTYLKNSNHCIRRRQSWIELFWKNKDSAFICNTVFCK